MKLLFQLLLLSGLCLCFMTTYDLPPCRKSKCRDCLNCTCESMVDIINTTAGIIKQTLAEFLDEQRFYAWAVNDTNEVYAMYNEAEKLAVTAVQSANEVWNHSSSAAMTVAEAFAATKCAVIPDFVLEGLPWFPNGGNAPYCKVCHDAFAESSKMVAAALKASMKATSLASSILTEISIARGSNRSPLSFPVIDPLEVGNNVRYSLGNITAQLYAQAKANCSDPSWNFSEVFHPPDVTLALPEDKRSPLIVMLKAQAKRAAKVIAQASQLATKVATEAAKAETKAKAAVSAATEASIDCQIKSLTSGPKIEKHLITKP